MVREGMDGVKLPEDEKAFWICECGKLTEQPFDKEPIRKCSCGKDLYKIKHPDGVINEYVTTPDFVVADFDKEDAKLRTLSRDLSIWQDRHFSALDAVTDLRTKVKECNKRINNLLQQGLRGTKDRTGLKLSKRQDMMWHFNRTSKEWLGRPKPPKPEGGKK